MYSRFRALENFGEEELERLQDSTAAVVGLGATGSVIAEHLARYGVNLIIIDRDYLEENDLYSSNIYTPENVDKSLPKAEAAAEYLSQFTDVEPHIAHLNGSNACILDDADIILDGTDNMETRFLISEYSQKNGVPWIYTAALAEKGYSMFFGENCFSCVFDQVKPGTMGTCETDGIMREVAAIAASRTSFKAVNYLAGEEVKQQLDVVPSGERLEVEENGCEVCENGDYSHLGKESETAAVCGEQKYQLEREVNEEAFESLRAAGEVVADNDYLTRVSVNGNEFVLFREGRAIIHARDRGHAEARFDEILGG